MLRPSSVTCTLGIGVLVFGACVDSSPLAINSPTADAGSSGSSGASQNSSGSPGSSGSGSSGSSGASPSAGSSVPFVSASAGPDSCVDPPDGGAPDGGAPDGGAPDGAAPDGAAPDGAAPDGATPDGGAPDGGPPAGPYVWQNATILGGGFVSGIEFSPAQPDLIYARTDVGGAYRWDATAMHWLPITDWVGRDNSNLTGIESIAPDPTDPNVVYVAAGQYLTGGNGTILRSADKGVTWTPNPIAVPMGGNADGRNMGERLAVDPNLPSTLYFGSRNSGLWTSTDSGTTWTQVTSLVGQTGDGGVGAVTGTPTYGLPFVFFDRRSGSPGTASSTIYVSVMTSTPAAMGTFTTSGAPSLYRTTDGGATWLPVPGEPVNMFPHHAAMDYATGILYFTYNDAPGPNNVAAGAVWKLDTSNDAWTNVSPPGNKAGFGGVTVDANKANTVIVTSLDRWPDEIYLTTNGGGANGGSDNWTAIGSPASRDPAGAQWLYWGGPSLTWSGWMGDIEIDPHQSGRVLYNTGQGLWWSDDATGPSAHWTFQDRGIEETVATALISPSGGVHLISGVGDLGGFVHADLTTSPSGGMFEPVFGSASSLDFAEQHPGVVVRVGTASSSGRTGHGAYSMDGGTTWTLFATEPTTAGPDGGASSANAGTIAISADGSTLVWASQAPRGGTAPPAYTRDLGSTWTACSGLPSGARVASDRVNPNRFYATAGANLYGSTDGGVTFSVVNALPPSYGATVRPTSGHEGDLWLSAGSGLFHETDASPTWTQVPGVQIASAVGFGRGATCESYPVLYLAGQANGVSGVYRSDDQAGTWLRVDDPQHQFGYINYITGDPRLYGRVYLGSGGRGILYGDPM